MSEKGEFQFNSPTKTELILQILDDKIDLKNLKSVKNSNISFYINNQDRYLRIDHFSKDVFHIDYYKSGDKKVSKGHYRKSSIENIIMLFFDDSHKKLIEALPREGNKISKHIDTFKKRDFTYRYRFGKRFVFDLILYTSLPVSMIILFLMSGSSEKQIVFLVVTALFSIPLCFILVIQANYKSLSKLLSINISSGNNVITANYNSQSIEFDKTDVKQIKIIEPTQVWNRNPFYGYGYSEIHFKDGRKLTLSNMIIPTYEMRFKYWQVPVIVENSYYPIIKEKQWLT